MCALFIPGMFCTVYIESIYICTYYHPYVLNETVYNIITFPEIPVVNLSSLKAYRRGWSAVRKYGEFNSDLPECNHCATFD
jgi:hypothetical protein